MDSKPTLPKTVTGNLIKQLCENCALLLSALEYIPSATENVPG